MLTLLGQNNIFCHKNLLSPGFLEGGSCTPQNIIEKPYLLSVGQAKFDNLTDVELVVPRKFPVLAYTSIGQEKLYLLEMDKDWFPEV